MQKRDTKRRTNLIPEPQDKHPRDVASPGFRLRQQNPLVKIEKGSRDSLVTVGVPEVEMATDDVTEKRMKQILGRMYNDKKYLEQLVEQAGTVPLIFSYQRLCKINLLNSVLQLYVKLAIFQPCLKSLLQAV